MLALLQYMKLTPALIITSVFLNIGLWFLAWFYFPQDSPAAVLHYSVGVGIDFIGPGRQILMLPIVGSCLLVINIMLARLIRPTSAAAYWMFQGANVPTQLTLLVAFLLIWRLN